ncbi:hypothetical protein SEA_KATCHAN_62 [Microbacterium phage KatChan]|nr:hypothetical protein SEA_KATCHAN_62 [Microbacterium phage KatChan]
MTTEQMDDVDAQRAGFKDAADQKAQQVMRQEMEAGVHKREDPAKLADVFEGEFGFDPEEDKAITEEALVIINEHGKGLRLGLKQWAIVQRLVEHGIISGRAGS